MPRVIRRVWYVFRPDFFVVCLLLRLEEGRSDLSPRCAEQAALSATNEAMTNEAMTTNEGVGGAARPWDGNRR